MIHVRIFHTVAAMTAAMIPLIVIASIVTIANPIVLATAVPRKYDPKKTRTAAMISAERMLMDLDETMVATILDTSWNPLLKLKNSPREIVTSANSILPIHSMISERDS